MKPYPNFRPAALTLAVLAACVPSLSLANTPPEVIEAINLATAGGSASATGETNSLNAAGTAAVGQHNNRAAVWSDTGGTWSAPTELAVPGLIRNSWAYGLNNNGGTVAVGLAEKNDPTVSYVARTTRPVIWRLDPASGQWGAGEDIGTVRSNKSGTAALYAVSDDGTVAAGYANTDGYSAAQAAVWRYQGGQWQGEALPVLSRGSGRSLLRAISGDGKVVGGWAYTNPRGVLQRAGVWHDRGGRWEFVEMDALKSDGSGLVRALNTDGTVAGGATTNDAGVDRAIIWQQTAGVWGKAQDLGTLKSGNDGSAVVYALNADGSIAGGTAQDDGGRSRAVVWERQKDQWTKAVDLGTLRGDNGGNATVRALSADGKVASGNADDDNGRKRAALWRLDYPSRAVDVDNTRAVLSRLGGDTLRLAEQQRQRLHDLYRHCRPDAVSGSLCYRLELDRGQSSGLGEAAVSANLGYALTPAWSAGVGVSHPLYREAPATYRRTLSGYGLSAYTQWQGGDWFVRGAVAHNNYRIRAVRPVLPGTEAGEGRSRMHGTSVRMTAGQHLPKDGGGYLNWEAGLEHSRVSRAGYTETNAAFPVTFGAVAYRDTSLLASVQLGMPLNGAWGWHAGAEAEYSLSSKTPEYTAVSRHIGSFRHHSKADRLRGSVNLGVDYRFSPQLGMSLTSHVGRNAAGSSRTGIRFGLNGRF